MGDRSAEGVAVLGAGSWGTALALLLARNGRPVTLWARDPEAAAAMAAARRNTRYLPEFPFPDGLAITADLAAAVEGAGGVLVTVPSHAFRATLERLRPWLAPGAVLAWGTKGLEPASGELLGAVAAQVLGPGAALGLVSGPTFAREVALGLPTALAAVSERPPAAAAIAGWLRNERVRVYTNDDMTGVQLAGAIKNVLAIAAGISDGLGFGANARAALITRGLAELTRLGVALGGRPETFMGLAGVGDLILTCTDDQSRNRRVGLALGRGRDLEGALREVGQEAEGVASARALCELARARGVELPITEQVHRVLHQGTSPQAAVEALLRRQPRPE